MTCSRKSLVCGSVCGLLAGLLVAGLWAIMGCTTGDIDKIKDLIDEAVVTPTTTSTSTTTTTLPDGPNEGENFVPPSSGVNEVQAAAALSLSSLWWSSASRRP